MSKDLNGNTPQTKEDLIAFVEGIKRQWMSTIDALVDPLMIVDRDYSIKKANLAMAKACKTDFKDLLGSKCFKVFANRNSPCPGCRMESAAKSNKPEYFELEDVNSAKYFEVTSQPIFDAEGALEGVVQVYRDRTDAKQLREQLLQSEKLSSIGLLAGGVAHEINNPLGGILVFSQMLMREMDKDSPHYEDVKEILHATERCKAIVENLLEFARTNPADRKVAKDEEFNVIEAAKTALRFARVSVPQHMIDIEEEWTDTTFVLKGDRNKVIQVFLNLIQNAVQAMPDGGTLTLKSNRVGDKIIFQVVDTGVGIPEEFRQKIFDPFFTTKEPGEGTGLGLAICYGIVKDLGGELNVSSKVNSGTSFSIEFPIAKSTRQSA